MHPPDTDRAVAWSRQLARAHAALRQLLRDAQEDPASAQPGRDLVTHCLALCSALSAHHQGEDAGLFSELLRVRPDLQDVVRKLTEDHQMIAGILTSLGDLLSRAADDAPPPASRQLIAGELAGLAAIMESHFSYEERAISDALDGEIRDTGWSAGVFGFRT